MSKTFIGTICAVALLSVLSVIYFLASISKDISNMESRFAEAERRRIEAEQRAARREEWRREQEEKEEKRIIDAAISGVRKQHGESVTVIPDGNHYAHRRDDGDWLASIHVKEITEADVTKEVTFLVTISNGGYVRSMFSTGQ